MSEEHKIGSNLRIKLPDDYQINEKQFTFNEYEEILKNAAQRFIDCKLEDEAFKQNIFSDMLYYDYKPPTRWQRFKQIIKNFCEAIRDIWIIVSGGDIHKDCGY
jgi:hypothetical protein